MSLLVGLFLIFVAFCAGFCLAALLSTGVHADELGEAHRRITSLQAALDDLINDRRPWNG